MKITFTHIDTACALLEINGYRILTDPTLDKAGGLYHHGYGGISRKTDNPSLPPEGLHDIDLVLLSHHQHKDNFDKRGQEFALTVPLILSTKKAAKEIKGITGLANWESYPVQTSKVPGLTITATPAQHHPWWVPHFIAGDVIGFVIQFTEQKNGVIYISGDTVYFKGIDEVAKRFVIDIGIFHLGSVQFRYLTGFGQYTMDGRGFLQAVQVLNPGKIIPIHYRGWSHFKESESRLRKVIDSDPVVRRRTYFLEPGHTVEL